MNDLRYAIRQLLKRPGFTTVAVLTLALGIGATTAIYSVVNATLLNPVPGPHPDRIVQICEWQKWGSDEPHFTGVAPPTLQMIRSHEREFEDFTWCDRHVLDRKTDGFVESIQGAKVAPNFFSFLHTPPLLGRGFAEDEAVPTNAKGDIPGGSVIIISHAFWMRELGGDKGAIGRTLMLSGHQFTVIGVMPPGFEFPWGSTKFWVPLEDPPVRPNSATAPNCTALARLKGRQNAETTRAMLNTWAANLRREFDNDSWQGKHGYGTKMRQEDWTLRMRPMTELFTDEKVQRTLLGLLGGIVFVLLIVCANIATLVLARTECRQQELAVRAALGASRLRLVRQLLTESLMLACFGGLGGLAATWLGMELLISLLPAYLPRLHDITVDSQALGFSLVVSLGTGVLFGLVPAMRAGRASAGDALKEAGARTTGGAAWRRYRNALVATEVALALVLLTGAGLMIQSVFRLLDVKPGFDPDHLLRIHVGLPWQKYASDPALKNPVLEALRERLAALPGVKTVGIGKDDEWTQDYEVEGRGRVVKLVMQGTGVEDGDLFRALRIPVLAGRSLKRGDVGKGSNAVLINETMARLCWPGQDSLGKRFSPARARNKTHYEVVGMVGDARAYRYDQSMVPTFYRPYHEMHLGGAPPQLVVRIGLDPTALIPTIRKEMKVIEPDMGTPSIRIVSQDLYDSTQAQRTYMLYLVAFAAVGLCLSAMGIYGVLAYSVARRTREIGIRMAVGAKRRHVLSMVIAEGGRLVGAGIIAGLIAAAWLMRYLESQLFEVSPTEPVVFAVVVLFLTTVALLACFLPARKAANLNPMEALRYE